MPRKQKTKKNEWPCGRCKKNCVSSCVFCAICEKWYHCACESVTLDKLKIISDNPEDYICETCRSDDGKFDFLMGLERLKQAAGHGITKLLSVANREALLVENRSVRIQPATLANMEIDPIADRLLHHYHFNGTNDAAITSTGDGDCLFNSVSQLLIGDETLSVELRYKTCLEMCLNKNIRTYKDAASFYYNSPTYDQAVLDCARIRSYSSVWTILALANVISTPLDVLYPCVNGTKDLSFMKLNMKLRPEEPVCEVPIKIMWSSTFQPIPGKTWTPNHFVPIVPKSSATQVKTKHLTFNFGFNNLSFDNKDKSTPKPITKQDKLQTRKTSKQKPLPVPEVISPVSVHSSPTYSLPSPNSTPPSSPEMPMPPRKRQRSTCEPPATPKMSKPKKQRIRIKASPRSSPVPSPQSSPLSSPMTSPLSSPENSFLSKNSFSVLEDEDCDMQTEETGEPTTLQTLTNDKFMTVDEAYKAVTTTPSHAVAPTIPRGPKNNVYLLLQRTSDNVHEFPDDCGAWGRAGTSVNSVNRFAVGCICILFFLVSIEFFFVYF